MPARMTADVPIRAEKKFEPRSRAHSESTRIEKARELERVQAKSIFMTHLNSKLDRVEPTRESAISYSAML